MTEDDVKRVAKEAIKEFLVALGVNAADGPAMIELQKDFAHVRENRLAMMAIKGKVILTLAGAAALSAATTIWLSMTGKH